MGGAGNTGQEPAGQTGVVGGGGGTPALPGWGSGGVPGGGPEGGGGVPPLAEEALGLRPYEEVAASTGGGPNTGLLAGSPVGKSDTSLLTYAGAPPTGFNTTGPGFQSTEYPERARRREEENRERQGLPAVPPTVAAPPEPTPVLKEAPPADPWAGRVQIFGSGAEGFGTDTSAQWLARWPSQARAEQKPGTDNWYLPVGVTR